MKDGWFYTSLGQTLGPVTFDTIMELAGSQQLLPSDQVRKGTDGAWAPADSIVGLFPEGASADVHAGELEVAQDLSDLNIVFASSATAVQSAPAAVAAKSSSGARAPVASKSGSRATPAAAPELADRETLDGRRLDDTRFKSPSARSDGGAGSAHRATASPTRTSPTPSAKSDDTRAAPAPSKPAANGSSSKTKSSTELKQSTAKRPADKTSNPPRKSVSGWEAPDEGDAWYGRAMGMEFGPMLFADLVLMASSGTLGETDHVRPGPDGPWIPAAEVSEIGEAITMWQFTDGKSHAIESPTLSPAGTSGAKTPSAAPVANGAAASAAAPRPIQPGAASPGTYPSPPVAAPAHAPTSPTVVTIGGQTFMQVAVRMPDGQYHTVLAPLQTHAGAPGMAAPPVHVPSPMVLPMVTQQVVTQVVTQVVPSPTAEAVEKDDEEEGAAADAEAARKERRDSEKWYCRTNGQEHGPVEFRYLRKTALAGKLKSDDMVRRGKKGQWVAASTVPELFDAEEEGGKIDLEKLVGASVPDAPPSTAQVGSSGAGVAGPSTAVDSLLRTAHVKAMTAAPVVVEKEPFQIGAVIEKIRENAMNICIGAVVLAVAAWFLIPGTDKDHVHVERTIQLYEEFCQLREKKATPIEWNTYTQKAKGEADKMLAEFKKTKILPGTPRAYLEKVLSEYFPKVIQYSQTTTGSEMESGTVVFLNRARLKIDPKAKRVVMPGASGDTSGASGSTAGGSGAPSTSTGGGNSAGAASNMPAVNKTP